MPRFNADTYGTKAELQGAAPFKQQTGQALAPPGPHPARLVKFLQVKDVTREYQGVTRKQDEIHILFELEGSNPRTFVATFGMRESWRSNAKLFLFCRQMFGPNPFPPDFGEEWFQNVTGTVEIEHRSSTNGTYAIANNWISDVGYDKLMSGQWKASDISRISPDLDNPVSPFTLELKPEPTPAPPANPAALAREIAGLIINAPAEDLDQLKKIRELLDDDQAFLDELQSRYASDEV